MIKTGTIIIPQGRYGFCLKVESVDDDSDDQGYVFTQCRVYELHKGKPALSKKHGTYIESFRQINERYFRSYDPQEFGYPGEQGLLPWYFKRWEECNKQLQLF